MAATFLDALAEGRNLDLTPPCKEKILQLIGVPVPYFIQILFSEVVKAQVQDDAPVTPKWVERIYRDKVLGVDCKTYFDHYYGRLRDYYRPQEERAVKRLLRELGTVGELTRDAAWQLYKKEIGEADLDPFNGLMTDLENDFYIRFDPDSRRYAFACKLLRDWWLRHYGL